jgi:lipopolysaccharide transport system permease protein
MNVVPAQRDLVDRSAVDRPSDTHSLVLHPASGAARQRAALHDLIDGARLWRLALTLGWLDIKLRYRGSILGPFWLTLSTAVMVAALGVVWGTLFHMQLANYLPFLGLSLVLWNSGLNGLATDACGTFIQADTTIRSVRMPFSVQIIRTLTRNVIALGHNIVVPIATFAIYDAWPGTAAFWALPGMLLWLIDGFAICMLLGAISARFRDIPPIIGSIMQIAFYITPVIWKPEQVSGRQAWMHYMQFNPFDSLLEVVRRPLLGHVITGTDWAFALAYSAALCLVGWLAFVRARSRLAFWV